MVVWLDLYKTAASGSMMYASFDNIFIVLKGTSL